MPVPDPRLAREQAAPGARRRRAVADEPAARPAASTRAARRRATATCDVEEPLLELKEGGNVAACHFPLTDEEIAQRVPTAAGVSAAARLRERAEFPAGTRTAADAAAAIGCEVGAICKSLVFRVGDAPLLVVATGSNRVDEARFGARARPTRPSCASRPASRSAACRPTATRRALETVVDEDLLAYDDGLGGGRDAASVFPIAPAELVARTGGRVARVSPGS